MTGAHTLDHYTHMQQALEMVTMSINLLEMSMWMMSFKIPENSHWLHPVLYLFILTPTPRRYRAKPSEDTQRFQQGRRWHNGDQSISRPLRAAPFSGKAYHDNDLKCLYSMPDLPMSTHCIFYTPSNKNTTEHGGLS